MKILMVNKFYYIKGGSETYYFALKQLLEAQGHEVIDFSMCDDKNLPSVYSDYFVRGVDYNSKQSIFSKINMAMKIIYSFEAKRKIEKLIKSTKPDLVHLHIFQHQMSPSILKVIKKYSIPVVYTAHDLKLVCPNYKMMTHDGICERCKNGKYIECVKHKCVKNSRVKSAVCMIEGYLHKFVKSYKCIDHIITPSNFYRNKFIEFGIPENKVTHIPNFLYEERRVMEKQESENYLLYYGRLSNEKGVMTLIKAMKDIDFVLYIVGTGPEEEVIRNYILENNYKNIKLLGFQSGQKLVDIVGNAKAVILPSEWYENGPYSAIESLQLARPIIGSDLGGIPELVEGNGFVFKHNDIKDLQQVICKLLELSSEKYHELEIKSRRLYDERYTANIHIREINNIYGLNDFTRNVEGANEDEMEV